MISSKELRMEQNALTTFKNEDTGYESLRQYVEDGLEMDDASILGPAALGLQRVGELPPKQQATQPGLLLNRRGMPARIRKKNRLFFDDDVVNTLLPRSTKRVRASPNKKGSTTPTKVPPIQPKRQSVLAPLIESHEYAPPETPELQEITKATHLADRRLGQRIGMRLRNILKLPKAHKWVCYEWLYSNIDLPLYEGDNDFMLCLKECLPQLHTRKLTRVEWAEIRRMMGKPRRCSQSFFEEERKELERKRAKIRLLQQRKTTDIANCKDLPEHIPLQLVIGSKVTARLRKPQDGLFTGSIDAVDTSDSTYRITFERQGLGTYSVPDYEVLSNDPPEKISLSSLAQKFRPRTVSSFITTPRFSDALLPGGVDPMLSGTSLVRPKSIPTDGMLGGFPVKCLDMVVRLSKVLSAKKNKINFIREMNSDAEKLKLFGQIIPPSFQHLYATTIVELEQLNNDLQTYLTSVQSYCLEVAPEANEDAILAPSHLQDRCVRDAKEMVERFSLKNKVSIKSKRISSLVTQLTALVLQVKSLSEVDRNTYEVEVLQSSMEQIRSQLYPNNQSYFQNSVEVHIQHVQTGLCHNTSQHPLMAQRAGER